MCDILDVIEKVKFDELITRIEYHAHSPYVTSTFNHNDEIRIPIMHQDIYSLPSKSFLYIEGKLEGPPAALATTKLVNNGIVYLFDEIRYELNGIEVDRTKNLGLTTTAKGYVSYTPNEVRSLQNAGWENDQLSIGNNHLNVCIPLKCLLGFAEDYNKIIINVRQELVLIRAKNDHNALYDENNSQEVTVKLNKIQWRVPYINVANAERLSLLKLLERNKSLQLGFRSWSTYEYPLLPATNKHTWQVKTSSQLEKPRYILIILQTDRKNNRDKNSTDFDHCEVNNVKLYLNSEYYPYDDMHLDFTNNKYALLYDMYTKFQTSYYSRSGYPEPLVNVKYFKNLTPIFVIDCSHKNESIKSATVDIRLEFESKTSFPPNTSAYCIIIQDRLVEYNPMTTVLKNSCK